jgi:hypothetical protein
MHVLSRIVPGAVSGDRLSFNVDMYNVDWGECRGVAQLKPGEAMLKGSMSCSVRFDSESYAIQIDILH